MSFRSATLPLVFAPVLALAFGACDPAEDEAEAPVCDGDPQLLSVTAPDAAAAGDMIAISFEVDHFEFSMEDDHDHDHGDHDDHDDHDDGHEDEHDDGHDGEHDSGDEGAQPGDDATFRAVDPISAETGCYVGHVHVYLDDLMTDPIAQITVASGEIMLPADLEAGEHRLISRLHDAGHKIIEPQVIVEHTITVQ